MHLMVLSVNHRTAGVAMRERLALNGQLLDRAYSRLRGRYPAVELVLLSTCNRTELYLARPPLEPPNAAGLLRDLSDISAVEEAALAPVAVGLENDAAVAHLFRVATGLESMVLGEPQILGQVKRAYEAASARGAVGPVFHRVFQQAIAVAKRVRSSTGIDTGRVSVGSAAVDFARQIFERFDDKTIVGIGAGEMAKPMLQHFHGLNPARLWLTNRSLDRARLLVSRLGLPESQGGARPFDALDDLLMEADIVLASTGASEPIITADRFKSVLRRRGTRPLYLIDIAVPRDIEPEVGQMANVYLYNIDDLQRVVDQTHGLRRQQIDACQAVLGDAVDACIRDVQNRDIGTLVRGLRQRLGQLGSLERERTQRKIAACRPDELAEKLPELIDEHTHRLINKILHVPLSRLDHQRPGPSPGFYAAALRVLFDLGDDAAVPNDPPQAGPVERLPEVKVVENRPGSDEAPQLKTRAKSNV